MKEKGKTEGKCDNGGQKEERFFFFLIKKQSVKRGNLEENRDNRDFISLL